jgi:rfaE bifunctional protein kinase chain/domain
LPMNKLTELVDRFPDTRIAVLGDLVIDEYIFGSPERISREAPVLIIRENARDVRLGGAGNVVANIRALGGRPRPVGLIGADDIGGQLMDLMANRGINAEGILVDPARFTTTKTRVLGGGRNTVRQQMLRIDRQSDTQVDKSIRAILIEHLRRALEGADALVVSDYAEGVVEAELFDEVMRIIQEKSVPVFVDSRHRIEHFLGADTLVPSEEELFGASKLNVATEEGLERAGCWLLQTTQCGAAMVKRGRKGVALFLPGQPTIKVPAYGPDEVADRTGAGDTVLAAYSLARSIGAEPGEALRMANTAGGISVTKSGTAVVEAGELKRALEGTC